MDKLLIEGKSSKGGSVPISGFKHAVVPIIAASVLSHGVVTLHNTPNIEDTRILTDILTLLGSQVLHSNDVLIINNTNLTQYSIPEDLSNRIHGSMYLFPVLLAKCGRIELGQTGGCAIGDNKNAGERPIEHVIDVLEHFGAQFSYQGNMIFGKSNGFHAANIDIRHYSHSPEIVTGPYVSGATKVAMLAAAVARGTSRIHYPYRKADVTELLAFLRTSGVPIQDDGTTLMIEGKPFLQSATHYLVSDLIEIITFITYAVYLDQPLCLTGITTDRVQSGLHHELVHLEEMGIHLQWEQDHLFVKTPVQIQGTHIHVTSQSMYSDSHPFFTLLLLLANTVSSIREDVWQHRFDYATQLVKLGAQLSLQSNILCVTPGRPYQTGITVHTSDLRSAAVLLLTALDLQGSTILTGASHLQRGYRDIIGQLRLLGAHLTEIND